MNNIFIELCLKDWVLKNVFNLTILSLVEKKKIDEKTRRTFGGLPNRSGWTLCRSILNQYAERNLRGDHVETIKDLSNLQIHKSHRHLPETHFPKYAWNFTLELSVIKFKALHFPF